jgi:hypothetical protein
MKYPMIRGYCEVCEEPIELEDEHYVFPGGYLVCTECADEWVRANYHRYGEVDLTD